MIDLSIEKYCHGCPYFEPEVVRLISENVALLNQVCCKDRDKCSKIASYIRDAIEEERDVRGGESMDA